MLLFKGWRDAPRPGIVGNMGITMVRGTVRRAGENGSTVPVELLVDSGAIYSVLPRAVWEALELRATRTAEFSLADGTIISRGVSECTFEIEGASAASPVVLGEAAEGPLLGAVTLETLGLMLNSLTRQLLPMRLFLGSVGCGVNP